MHAYNNIIDLFLVSPGDGEEFVYFPVGVNATLHCAVNNTNLAWVIDGLSLDNRVQGAELHSRGIFQNELALPSNGVMSSNVTVFGRREINNNLRICCQSYVNGIKENCTILILYGRNTELRSEIERGNILYLYAL